MIIKSFGQKCLSINSIDFCIGLYIASIILVDGTIPFYISTGLLCIVGYLNFFFERKVYIGTYVFLMFTFILYNFLLIALGVAKYPDDSWNRLFTVTINFFVNYLVFIYFIKYENRVKMMKCFIFICWILIAYILIFDFSSILMGRFGDETPYLFGLRGTNGDGYNANFISKVIYLSIIFSIYFGCSLPKKTHIWYMNIVSIALLLFLLFLTGSRTGLIITILFFILFYVLKAKRIEVGIKYIFIGLFFVLVLYIAIMSIPVLYNIIGSRVEVLLKGLLSGGNYEFGTSAYYRKAMIDMGLDFFYEKPLFGWGLDSFARLSIHETYSHNNFIEILVSCGLIGFLIYYLAYFVLLKNSFKAIKKSLFRLEGCMFFSLLLPMLIMNTATINYLDRLSLFIFYMCAGAIYKQNNERIE